MSNWFEKLPADEQEKLKGVYDKQQSDISKETEADKVAETFDVDSASEAVSDMAKEDDGEVEEKVDQVPKKTQAVIPNVELEPIGANKDGIDYKKMYNDLVDKQKQPKETGKSDEKLNIRDTGQNINREITKEAAKKASNIIPGDEAEHIIDEPEVESTIQVYNSSTGKYENAKVKPIDQSLEDDWGERDNSHIQPEMFIESPLSNNPLRGTQMSPADCLNHRVHVRKKHFDANAVGNADVNYKREGGSVRAGVGLFQEDEGPQGGSLNKGFDPNGQVKAANAKFLYYMKGITVIKGPAYGNNKQEAGSLIDINQGFNTMNEAQASINSGLFLMRDKQGKVTMCKIQEGDPQIFNKRGKLLCVYSNERWLKTT